jgi:hypothetical protein
MIVSAWWVFWAFLGGSCAGIVLMALMFVASAEDDQVNALIKSPAADHAGEAHVGA